jgi:hypothetical protein
VRSRDFNGRIINGIVESTNLSPFVYIADAFVCEESQIINAGEMSIRSTLRGAPDDVQRGLEAKVGIEPAYTALQAAA